MRVRHTIAAGLAAILLIQSAAVAQTVSDPDIRTISHEQGMKILIANLHVGSELWIDVADGHHFEGRLVEKTAQTLVVAHDRQRQTVATADVVQVRVPTSARMTGGKAFGIGTAIGAGAILGLIFLATLRH